MPSPAPSSPVAPAGERRAARRRLSAQWSIRLSAVFQPIVEFSDGGIHGFEGLIRGPSASALETPHALFSAAAAEGSSMALELAAARTCLQAFAALDLKGKLFLNFSASVIQALAEARDRTLWFVRRLGLDPERIVIELTEQSTITDLPRFMQAIGALRETGAQFALDDYGTANASMNLWIRLRPDIVKIDRFFVDDIASDSLKFEAVKAMQRFASASGTRLVAEGIENEADLIVVRDLGIGCGQGFFFGMPSARPATLLSADILQTMLAGHIAVFPEAMRTANASPSGGMAAAKMMTLAPALERGATNNEVFDLFVGQPDLHALAVVEGTAPVALINRRGFMDLYALPYHRELFGKRSCLLFANMSPVCIDKTMTVEQMAKLLASDDQRYLADGFVITDEGCYAGLGTGESLVRAVTEVRIEAARYANPLTFLPGNIPISSHITRLISHEARFYACYVDLNHFKPFNDQYGYWQGDEVLKFAASVLAEACEPTRDFLGHVGGDDFLILFQSQDWEARTVGAIHAFNEGAKRFYAPGDRLAGGIRGEDRHGHAMFYSFVTMAIGCVRVDSPTDGLAYTSEEIATVAALAKRRAKQNPSGFVRIDAEEASRLLRGR